ncbi:4Fe-4S binding domain protein [Rosistilla carotiformis]|uniref:4Fe-4S binding domain protein n=1 Tax=Rosistilla carotiformis TaxID=2528017 RepID=A0A518JQM6_9BACT|nr:ferredoxin family protein [Rosistilla carotiformis]QDV67844.1 4Fe-4S binding domain protein [Rosistilla carotiformis]
MSNPLTVVISQGQSRNPEKRGLEQAVAEQAAAIDGVSVLLIPHLYDLTATGESLATLRSVRGDMVILAWVFERATHWILDRGGVRGQVGEVLLVRDEEDDDPEDQAEESQIEEKERVAEQAPRPNRIIYSLDFRVTEAADRIVTELQRIAALPRSVSDSAAARFAEPTNTTSLRLAGNSDADDDALETVPQTNGRASEPVLFGIGAVTKIDETPSRRWYPVIDFSRCTNCMECIDFCLFGVYGVDTVETILVEQPDNCRKGCPACSRVCPENAIIFPQHKSPGIAGAPVEAGGLKIDLSKLFGAPDADEDPIATAARERDEQLLLAGRATVGLEVGIPKRQSAASDQPKDDLDNLLDELDELDL